MKKVLLIALLVVSFGMSCSAMDCDYEQLIGSQLRESYGQVCAHIIGAPESEEIKSRQLESLKNVLDIDANRFYDMPSVMGVIDEFRGLIKSNLDFR